MTEPTPEAYEAAHRAIKATPHAGGAPNGLLHRFGQAAVDAVWPIAEATVRAKVAAEIRATLRQLVDPVQLLIRVREGDADEHPLMMGLHFAARIAEGNGDET